MKHYTRWFVKKSDVSLTLWLYGLPNLHTIKNFTQEESYNARIELLKRNLYHATYCDTDYNRGKDINEAIKWWRERYKEVYD